MMTGKIEPFDRFNKVNNIGEAASLTLQIDDKEMDEETKKMYIYTEILQALIMSNQKFNSDEAMINKAKNLGNKILNEIKKP